MILLFLGFVVEVVTSATVLGTPDWKFEGFHIHKATQRYQELGIQEEGFAEKTNKYTDWKGALKCAMSENNCTIEVAPNQKRL